MNPGGFTGGDPQPLQKGLPTFVAEGSRVHDTLSQLISPAHSRTARASSGNGTDLPQRIEPEIRNPKSETNSNVSMTEFKARHTQHCRRGFKPLDLGHCDLIRISVFGFRISG
jgi:hypothetical protein